MMRSVALSRVAQDHEVEQARKSSTLPINPGVDAMSSVLRFRDFTASGIRQWGPSETVVGAIETTDVASIKQDNQTQPKVPKVTDAARRYLSCETLFRDEVI